MAKQLKKQWKPTHEVKTIMDIEGKNFNIGNEGKAKA